MPAPAETASVHDWPLPYVDRLPMRELAAIDLVVMHCTELPDLATAREYGERVLYDTGTGASGHFYVDRDGTVHAFVPLVRAAHHTRGYNPRSLGIELVNSGRYPHWFDTRHQAMAEPYTEAQLAALERLLHDLRHRLPNLHLIAGHEDLDTARVPASDDPAQTVWRKRDPGPQFPWSRILAASGLERLQPPA